MEQLYGAVPCRAMLYEANAPGAALRVSPPRTATPQCSSGPGQQTQQKPDPAPTSQARRFALFLCPSPLHPLHPLFARAPSLHPRVGGLHRHGIKQQKGDLMGGSWAGSEQPFAKQRSSAVCVCACGRAFDHTWCVCCGNPPDTIWRNPSQRALARVLVGCREALTAQPRSSRLRPQPPIIPVSRPRCSPGCPGYALNPSAQVAGEKKHG